VNAVFPPGGAVGWALAVEVIFGGEGKMLCSRKRPPMTAARMVATAPIMAAMMVVSSLNDFFGACT